MEARFAAGGKGMAGVLTVAVVVTTCFHSFSSVRFKAIAATYPDADALTLRVDRANEVLQRVKLLWKKVVCDWFG